MSSKLSLCALISLLGGACAAEPADGTIPSEINNPWAGQNSGFAWQNGFANSSRDDEYNVLRSVEADYLGRRTDVFTSFLPHDDMDAVTRRVETAKRDLWTAFAAHDIRVVQVVPLLFAEDEGHVGDVLDPASPRHARYVAFWHTVGRTLAAAKAKEPVLRLGHEMNLGPGYPWSVNEPGGPSPAQFRQLFVLAANAVRQEKPDAVRCWNPGKASSGDAYIDAPGHKADDLYPGDANVDVVCVDWYDNGGGGVPMMTQDSDWGDVLTKRNDHGPVGIGAWYAFAQAHGKPIAFPEWALTDKQPPFSAADDRTVFIDHMHAFFAQAARDGKMMFESYYNGDDSHQLWPVTPYFKRASAEYKKVF
jgi:hypothetical protein